MATNKIREEEVKNIIRQEFFQDYDATPILGDLDFAVTTKNPIKCYHNNIHLMESEKYNKVCLAINFTTLWNCATTSRTSCRTSG